MNKLTIIGISIIVLIITVIIGNLEDKCPSVDSKTHNWEYCNHMGYERIINYSLDDIGNRQHKLVCIFDDNTSCPTWDFYYGDCGQDKVRDVPNRKLCESVYTAFEKCEEGLVPSETKYILEINHCREINWWERLKEVKPNSSP